MVSFTVSLTEKIKINVKGVDVMKLLTTLILALYGTTGFGGAL